ELGAVAAVSFEDGALLVLADPDLLALRTAHDFRGHLRPLRRELGFAVAADEEHRRVERLAVCVRELVHEQPLPFLDAVLLAAEGDDRISHGSAFKKMRACEPAWPV